MGRVDSRKEPHGSRTEAESTEPAQSAEPTERTNTRIVERTTSRAVPGREVQKQRDRHPAPVAEGVMLPSSILLPEQLSAIEAVGQISGRSHELATVKRLGIAPRLSVTVTDKHIAEAERRNSGHCMIADAVREAAIAAKMTPSHVSVDLQTIRFTDSAKQKRYVYLTPRQGQVLLIDFDQGRPTSSFAFQLRGGQVVNSGRGGRTVPSDLKKLNPSAVQRTGGKTPPRSGVRRAFGIRAYRD